jgi:hypothetical protein
VSGMICPPRYALEDGQPNPGATGQMGRNRAGRDPDSWPTTLFGATEDASRLAGYRDQGIARMVVMLPFAKADQILPTLDRWRN